MKDSRKSIVTSHKSMVAGLLLCTVCFVLCSSLCFAADITFEARIDRDVISVGERTQLSLTFNGAQNVQAPALPEIDEFTSQYLGPSTRMSIINGQVSSSITHNYILVPLKEGKFTIGPFDVFYRGRTYQAGPIKIEVSDSGSASWGSRAPFAGGQGGQKTLPVPGAAEAQLKDRIFVEIEVPKTDIFLKETMPLTVRLYVNRLAIKDIEFPIIPSEGFMKEDFEKPRQYQRTLAGLVYEVIEFKTSIYPVTTGTLTLGPAQIRCNMITRNQARQSRPGGFFDDFFGDDFFNGFFGGYEAYPLELKSTQLDINVRPYPSENRPPDFKGAVGDFGLEVEASPREVNAGDPITVKMKVYGKGNFSTVDAPSLKARTGDFKIYDPQSKLQPGEKDFEQAVIPSSEKTTQVPVISFSFFNPETKSYRIIEKGPIAITVKKAQGPLRPNIVEGPSAGLPVQEKDEVLGKDIIYIKDRMGTLRKTGQRAYKNAAFPAYLAAPPALFFVVLLFSRRRERIRTDVRYARALRAPGAAKKGLKEASVLLNSGKRAEFFGALSRTLAEYIADRLHIPAGGITADIVDRKLRPRGVDEDTLRNISRVFSACDMAKFSARDFSKDEAEKLLKLARKAIDYLERAKL